MSDWPELDVQRDAGTFATLHLASQMLGKLRVAHAPWTNHGWNATSSLTPSLIASVMAWRQRSIAKVKPRVPAAIGAASSP